MQGQLSRFILNVTPAYHRFAITSKVLFQMGLLFFQYCFSLLHTWVSTCRFCASFGHFSLNATLFFRRRTKIKMDFRLVLPYRHFFLSFMFLTRTFCSGESSSVYKVSTSNDNVQFLCESNSDPMWLMQSHQQTRLHGIAMGDRKNARFTNDRGVTK